MLIQDYLDICDPVLTFDRFMGEIELEKYLKNIPQHYTGRLRYDPVSMLKTVLFSLKYERKIIPSYNETLRACFTVVKSKFFYIFSYEFSLMQLVTLDFYIFHEIK